MLHIIRRADSLTASYDIRASLEVRALREPGVTVESRWDWKDYATVEALAAELTEKTGKQYLGTDAGSGCSPRFDIERGWVEGEPVSYAFNGDYYPCGTIVKIVGEGQRIITTSTGAKFYRRKTSGNWKKTGGTWSLVAGHHTDKNPSF
jgi:hypothetical protein